MYAFTLKGAILPCVFQNCYWGWRPSAEANIPHQAESTTHTQYLLSFDVLPTRRLRWLVSPMHYVLCTCSFMHLIRNCIRVKHQLNCFACSDWQWGHVRLLLWRGAWTAAMFEQAAGPLSPSPWCLLQLWWEHAGFLWLPGPGHCVETRAEAGVSIAPPLSIHCLVTTVSCSNQPSVMKSHVWIDCISVAYASTDAHQVVPLFCLGIW